MSRKKVRASQIKRLTEGREVATIGPVMQQRKTSTGDSCHPDMLRFWELLTEGVVAGRQLLAVLCSIQQALPSEPMGNAAASLADDVQRGMRLSDAMRNQPSIFTKAHVCFVQCGEYVGQLDRLLLLLLELTRECPTCGNLKFPT